MGLDAYGAEMRRRRLEREAEKKARAVEELEDAPRRQRAIQITIEVPPEEPHDQDSTTPFQMALEAIALVLDEDEGMVRANGDRVKYHWTELDTDD